LKKNRIFITGYYGFGNTGDEAILTAMLAQMRQLQPDLHISATSANPAKTAAQHGIQAVLWSDAFAVLEAVAGADLVIIGGGGLFHDYWGIDPNAFLTDNHSGIGFYTTSAVLAALYAKPLMLYAVGVGPLTSEHSRRFTRVTCDAAQNITVRDLSSRELLESLGVPASKIEVTADPVFAFPLPEKIQNEPRPAGAKIGISLRNWNLNVHPGFWEAEVATALDRTLQNEPTTDIDFYPFQRLTGGEMEDDIAVARRVRDLMKNKERVHILEDDLSPADLLAHMSECSLIVGMRLHALIFGVLANVPVLALSYDPKIDQLMEQIGLRHLSMDIKAIDNAELARLISEALQNAAAIRATIANHKAELQEAAKKSASSALKLLQNEFKPQPLSHEATLLLRRGIETQLRSLQTARSEIQRLFKETEYYLAESQRNGRRVDELSSLISEHETAFDKSTHEAATAHYAEIVQLEARIAQLGKERRAIESVSTARLQEAERIRQKVITGLDSYQEVFQRDLASYRNQKAWQIMLVLRKAYTLLFRRGAGEFFKWILSWPLRGLGDLAEYDLQFPNPWSYMPGRLEASCFLEEAPPQIDFPDPSLKPPAESIAARKLTDILPEQKYDIVILAVFDFEFRFQRPQQIASEFARRGHRVFWLSPGRFLPPSHPKVYEAIQLRQDLWELHLRGKNPELYTGSLADADADSICAGLAEVYKDFGIAENCVFLQFPFWRRIGLSLRERFNSRVVYDCMDDWQNWTAEPRISKWNLEEEKKLAREADVLIVTAKEFFERQQAAGLHPVLARNAADFDFFASPRPNNLLTDKSKPIIGYFGAIADWFDIGLMTRVAELLPQFNFVFIGHVYALDTAKIESLPNVSFLGEKNYREIPLYLSHFDVCLIPFVLNNLIKGVDPVKVYEYFSQGKPVVASNMPELAQMNDLLYIGGNAEDFAAKIDRAVHENNPDLRHRRIEYAKANTWAARVDVIDPAICDSFPKVSILVVTYNGEEFLEPFFDSIQRNTAWPNYEIVIVDNNSNEATRETLRRYAAADERIHLELLDRNSGFSGGNNTAARKATGEYLIFLNPDTIVTPGWLERMLRHCRRDPSIGAVAAITNFSGNETKVNINYENVIEMQSFALQLAKDNFEQNTEISVAALYCVLVPKTVWDKVGELDETFEVGMFEDDDFSLRIHKAGYRVIAADDAFIHHFGNGSFATIPSQDALRIFEQNKKRFESKWDARWAQHKLRPGIRSPFEERRIAPADFLRVGSLNGRRPRFKLSLRKLHPSSCVAQIGFNKQPNGQSALGIECDNAIPGTAIVWGSTILASWYEHPSLLSALVPPELYESPGPVEIYLMNDFGESNRLEFTVKAKSHSMTSV
jgi:polysaccharide pyruvyl transferase CsaB